ncbi:peptide ABC transporter substrate-binding protein [Clostridium hydrogenum]|uniref:peptide ABC transporter substrate-binding protein n=1 Tax=Clostridium hydrogenum TaxID=2855764 RepID=UPI001F2CACC7|nr:peptide ABC transporter substrate-binding protein [Clostridium hydrogenum]
MDNNRTKVFACALILIFVLTAVGCKSQTKTKKVDQNLNYNIIEEPENLDPAVNTTSSGKTIIGNIFEGLTTLNDKSKPVVGVAEKWNVSSDGTKYTFFLKKDAKWSDGKQVKAYDFEYAWKRILNKNLGLKNAYKLYCLKNGEAYNNGSVSDNEVGVKAIDDSTLSVTLEKPMPNFLILTASQICMPVRSDLVQGNSNWATSDKTCIGNGPFMLKEWKKKEYIQLVKNSNYVDRKKVKLKKIKFTFETDSQKYYKKYNSDKLDIIASPPEEVKKEEVKVYKTLGVYFYAFNLNGNSQNKDIKAISDSKVRNAISISLNRKIITENILSDEEVPATSIIPSAIKDNEGKAFNSGYYSSTGDLEKAKKLLSEAGYENGKDFPKIKLIYLNEEKNKILAEEIKSMLKKNLNIELETKGYDNNTFTSELANKNYTLVAFEVDADYLDPIIFLDSFVTGRGSNIGGYNSEAYNNLIKEAKDENIQYNKFSKMKMAQEIFMNDMPIIPICEPSIVVAQKQNVKGAYTTEFGVTYFKEAFKSE